MDIQAKLEAAFRKSHALSAAGLREIRGQIAGFAPRLPRDGVYLDIGCGESPFRGFFKSKRYVTLDIATASRPGVVGDAHALPFRDAVVDVAVCTEVLEHLDHPEVALGEIARVLRSDGFLVLTVPFMFGVHGTADFQRWTKDGLTRLLQQRGFQIALVEEAGGIFVCLAELLRQIPYQLFGPYKGRRNYVKYGAIVLFHVSLVPITWFLTVADNLDRNKNYTKGYCILAQKFWTRPG